ncbi:MAG: hypothetical protein SFW36_22315 [Leptolyngbyaceae cyanobacterium bins.59]|nr:hypothetical protein [Leptolyngbyaceae cyanobacterium bins.59]
MIPLIGLLGCGVVARSDDHTGSGVPLSEPQPSSPITAIRDLSPAQSNGTLVNLQGQVGKQVPFLGSRAYELQDGTGAIWVLTTQQAPAIGTPIVVRGKVRYQQVTVDNQRMREIYLEEQESVVRPSPQPSSP